MKRIFFIIFLYFAGCDVLESHMNRGDVTEDGVVNCDDAAYILCELNGEGCYIPERLWDIADVDFDGSITEMDAYSICPKLQGERK